VCVLMVVVVGCTCGTEVREQGEERRAQAEQRVQGERASDESAVHALGLEHIAPAQQERESEIGERA